MPWFIGHAVSYLFYYEFIYSRFLKISLHASKSYKLITMPDLICGLDSLMSHQPAQPCGLLSHKLCNFRTAHDDTLCTKNPEFIQEHTV